jgi:hypothetical protein
VKAIMDGRKTQTRRLAGLEKINKNPDGWELSMWEGKPTTAVNGVSIQVIPKPLIVGGDVLTALKPRYLPGETVYVKETYLIGRGTGFVYFKDSPNFSNGNPYTNLGDKWHSPMMMPEKYARTFLLIKDVRPERLRDITEQDARAEGTLLPGFFASDRYWITYRDGYERLWDSINKKPGMRWQDSPWVWRYVFSPTEQK